VSASLPRDGYRDLRRRLRILRLTLERSRLRRALFNAEAELGWLGWEQVEFYDAETTAQVAKIQEFENTQAFLQNTSAELSGKKAGLDEELARENTRHDETQASLAAERGPIVSRIQEAETTRERKIGSIERFSRALGEISAREQWLESRSRSFMNIVNPTMEIRAAAREVSDELAQLIGERKLVLADKATAAVGAETLEAEIAHLRSELQRIDTAAEEAREALAAASRRMANETRTLERAKEKSSLQMAHLDREKQKPYRFIGACLADHNIAPRNQPQCLEKVLELRDRERQIEDSLLALQTACSAAEPIILVTFYLLLIALIFALSAVTVHFLS